MKITQQQIDALYKFTRQHYVVHYDLQTELVDHLANDIEQVWKTYPNISFEEARDRSFKKFGVFGFMDVVEARQKTMNKRYRKVLWSFVKEWLTLPKLIKTLLLFVVSFTVFSLKYGEYIAVTGVLIISLFIFIRGFKYTKYIKRKEKPGQRLWLLEDLIFRNVSVNGSLLLSFFVNSHNIVGGFWEYKHMPFLAALVFTFICIYTYVSVVVLPKNSEILLKKQYPEYAIV